ncbi:hypothetical protein QTH97_22005 [Variovorax sp. J22R24]|uniref:hypothetical protein n=1 Tax=Variovorax gracilis TaxID=3053502 RepID=UPI0025764721|nr:hypothetical protein [Variovorax sp. J22R24]MDM0107638.1 hypothetical protein [Variovorax sp. J22R24]
MTRLIVSGDNGGPVRWGSPVYLCVNSRAIASAEVAALDGSGRLLHIEHFRPLGISAEHAIAVRKLALLEIIFHAMSLEAALCRITVSLHYRAPGEDEGIAEAAARASFLRSFGATEITVVPDVAQKRAGQYVVNAIWEPHPTALQMLEECLALEQARYKRFTTSPSLQRRMKQWLRPVTQRLRAANP